MSWCILVYIPVKIMFYSMAYTAHMLYWGDISMFRDGLHVWVVGATLIVWYAHWPGGLYTTVVCVVEMTSTRLSGGYPSYSTQTRASLLAARRPSNCSSPLAPRCSTEPPGGASYAPVSPTWFFLLLLLGASHPLFIDMKLACNFPRPEPW